MQVLFYDKELADVSFLVIARHSCRFFFFNHILRISIYNINNNVNAYFHYALPKSFNSFFVVFIQCFYSHLNILEQNSAATLCKILTNNDTE